MHSIGKSHFFLVRLLIIFSSGFCVVRLSVSRFHAFKKFKFFISTEIKTGIEREIELRDEKEKKAKWTTR